jgi:cytochrome P450
MLFLSFTVLLYALPALVILQVVSVKFKRSKNAREARQRGCEPPPTARNRGFFGLMTLVERVRATKNGWGPVWMHQAINEIGKDVHTVRAPVFDYELLITRDVENAKAIFATNSQDFDIGLHREKTFKYLLGLGIMTGQGDKWKHSRALIHPQFSRDNIADLTMLQRHVDALVRRLRVADDGWTAKVDLSLMFQDFTLDTGTEFILGQSVHMQDPEARAKLAMNWDKNAPELATFGTHLDGAKYMLGRRGALAKYGWLLRDNKYPQHVKAVQTFVDYFVEERLRRNDDEKAVQTASGKTKFVLLEELAKETKDPLELRSELLNILYASRNTTAALSGWVFYFLVRHQQVFDRLRKEVLDNFGSSPRCEVSYTALMASQYMHWIINETIRMVGIVPMNERMALRNTRLPSGGGPDGTSPVFVPKGVQVLIPTYSMQHREDLWGADVEEYRPERWQDRKFGWDFIPFGGGARQCLGRNSEISLTVCWNDR